MYLDMIKIHTQKGFHILNIIFGNINGLKQVKLTFLVNQISFPFNVRNVFRIVADKRYFNPTADSPQRNNIVRFVGHYPTIVGNTTKRLESTFGFLIKFVSIRNFCNTSYQYLTTKFKRGFIGMVCSMMEFKIIENILLPSNVRNGIANSISLLHCVEKQVSLFISRQKFYFQCEFHNANIQLFSYIRKYSLILSNNLKALRVAYLPPSKERWVSRSIL